MTKISNQLWTTEATIMAATVAFFLISSNSLTEAFIPISFKTTAPLCNRFDSSSSKSRNNLGSNSWGHDQLSTATLFSTGSDGDDYDDWFADFNPADFESVDSNGGNYNDDYNDSRSYGGNRRRGGGRGGNGGKDGHDYTRDPIDNSEVPLDIVNDLMAQRLQCRKTGRFDEADRIRDDLLDNYGVLIRDKERTWRTGGSRGGSGGKWLNGDRDRRGGRDNSWGGGRRGGRGDRGGRRPQKDFGPNGHDYELARDAGPNTSDLEEDEIHELLAERLQSKLNRNYRRADEIQQELMEAGVLVNDGGKVWRADGNPFEGFHSRRYAQDGDRESSDLSEQELEEIQDLVDERAQCKAERLYRRADSIRDDLVERFNVYIDDKRMKWSVGGMMQERRKKEFEPFTMAPTSTADFAYPEEAQEIQALVEERDAARSKRDFDTADRIRDELLEQHNVSIDDRLRQWSQGGYFESQNKQSGREDRTQRGFVRRGSLGNLSEDDEAEIQKLLVERAELKRERDYAEADRIRDLLYDDFEVRVDDRNQQWHVESSSYALSQDSPVVLTAEKDGALLKEIESKIAERTEAKIARDYDTADAIRDELREDYGVEVDDRLKEWSKMYHEDQESFDDDDEDDEWGSDEPEASLEEDNEEEDDDEEEESSDPIPSASSDDEESLSKLTVPDLKEKLRVANLPVSGRKSELIERLLAHQDA